MSVSFPFARLLQQVSVLFILNSRRKDTKILVVNNKRRKFSFDQSESMPCNEEEKR